jgi:hypothetical protein
VAVQVLAHPVAERALVLQKLPFSTATSFSASPRS